VSRTPVWQHLHYEAHLTLTQQRLDRANDPSPSTNPDSIPLQRKLSPQTAPNYTDGGF
jgi:hypothetical protein